MNTDAMNNKTDNIDRAIHLATIMGEKALAHADAVAKFGADSPQAKAWGARWVETKDDLRAFLAVTL